MNPVSSKICRVVKIGVFVRSAIAMASDVLESNTTCLSPSVNVSSEENIPSSNLYIKTSCNLMPYARTKLVNRSWVRGRGGIIPSSFIAIDCAASALITTGIRLGPPLPQGLKHKLRPESGCIKSPSLLVLFCLPCLPPHFFWVLSGNYSAAIA